MNDPIPVGTEVHCKYLDYEFDGRIARHPSTRFSSQYLIEVIRGTGHQQEICLHDGGNGEAGDCWFVLTKDVREKFPEYKYDPSQQGDREDDI